MDRWRAWVKEFVAQVSRMLQGIRVTQATAAERQLQRRSSRYEPVSPRLIAIEKARQQLLAASSYFDCVSDPDLVDIAIYSLQAAQLRYSYLIRQAKQDQVHVPGLGRMLAK